MNRITAKKGSDNSVLSSHQVGNVTLHVAEVPGPKPDAPTIVLIHSLGCDLRIWSAMLPLLAAHARVLCYDIRGHGLSQTGTEGCSIETHSADLISLIETQLRGPAVVCGLSIGGLIAMAAALARPDLVCGLILCDTNARIGDATRYQDRIDRVRQSGIAAIAQEQMARWFSNSFAKVQAGQVALMSEMLVRQPVAGYLASVAALRDADYTAKIGEISAPTLCLVGEEDLSTPPHQVRGLARRIPGASFETIAGVGHLPCLEAPTETAGHILRFIGSLK